MRFFVFLVSLVSTLSCTAPQIPKVRYTLPNGIVTAAFPEVGQLILPGGRCTVAAIAQDTIVTAGHCIEGEDKNLSHIEMSYGAFPIHAWVRLGGRDVALLNVILPPKSPILKLSSEVYDLVDDLVFVGFGCSSFRPDLRSFGPIGEKRTTRFHITRPEVGGEEGKDLGKIIFRDENIRVCPGDSGGPIISFGSRRLVGIAVAYRESADSHLYVGTVIEELISLGKALGKK